MKHPFLGPFKLGPHRSQIYDSKNQLVCNLPYLKEGGHEFVEQALNEKWNRDPRPETFIVSLEDYIEKNLTFYADEVNRSEGFEPPILCWVKVRETPSKDGLKKTVMEINWNSEPVVSGSSKGDMSMSYSRFIANEVQRMAVIDTLTEQGYKGAERFK